MPVMVLKDKHSLVGISIQGWRIGLINVRLTHKNKLKVEFRQKYFRRRAHPAPPYRAHRQGHCAPEPDFFEVPLFITASGGQLPELSDWFRFDETLICQNMSLEHQAARIDPE